MYSDGVTNTTLEQNENFFSGMLAVFVAMSRVQSRAGEVQGPRAAPFRAEQRPGLLFIDRGQTKNGSEWKINTEA